MQHAPTQTLAPRAIAATLPYELMYLIFDYLELGWGMMPGPCDIAWSYDKSLDYRRVSFPIQHDLLASSLVCRSWSACATSKLYDTVVLCNWRAVSHFATALRSDPALARLVHHLVLPPLPSNTPPGLRLANVLSRDCATIRSKCDAILNLDLYVSTRNELDQFLCEDNLPSNWSNHVQVLAIRFSGNLSSTPVSFQLKVGPCCFSLGALRTLVLSDLALHDHDLFNAPRLAELQIINSCFSLPWLHQLLSTSPRLTTLVISNANLHHHTIIPSSTFIPPHLTPSLNHWAAYWRCAVPPRGFSQQWIDVTDWDALPTLLTLDLTWDPQWTIPGNDFPLCGNPPALLEELSFHMQTEVSREITTAAEVRGGIIAAAVAVAECLSSWKASTPSLRSLSFFQDVRYLAEMWEWLIVRTWLRPRCTELGLNLILPIDFSTNFRVHESSIQLLSKMRVAGQCACQVLGRLNGVQSSTTCECDDLFRQIEM